MLVWQPLAETPMNGFVMKQAIRLNLARDLGADLAVGRQAVGGAQRVVNAKFSSSCPGASS